MIRFADEQWERIRDHLPEENIGDGRPRRKPTPTRCVIEAVPWILLFTERSHLGAFLQNLNLKLCRDFWTVDLTQPSNALDHDRR